MSEIVCIVCGLDETSGMVKVYNEKRQGNQGLLLHTTCAVCECGVRGSAYFKFDESAGYYKLRCINCNTPLQKVKHLSERACDVCHGPIGESSVVTSGTLPNVTTIAHLKCYFPNRECACGIFFHDRPLEWAINPEDRSQIVHNKCKISTCSKCQKVIKFGTIFNSSSVMVGGAKFHKDCFDLKTIGCTCGGTAYGLSWWWPAVWTVANHKAFPLGFRVYVSALVVSLRRMGIRIPKDVLGLIVNAMRKPNRFHYQNGIAIKSICTTVRCAKQTNCKICRKTVAIVSNEIGCTSATCSLYSTRCKQCYALIPYGADPSLTCTAYRCITTRCDLCGQQIAPFGNGSPGLCTFDMCTIPDHQDSAHHLDDVIKIVGFSTDEWSLKNGHWSKLTNKQKLRNIRSNISKFTPEQKQQLVEHVFN
jgi:hypothetical protein